MSNYSAFSFVLNSRCLFHSSLSIPQLRVLLEYKMLECFITTVKICLFNVNTLIKLLYMF